MKSIKEVLQLGFEKYKNEPNSFMCCILDDLAYGKIITEKESDKAQRRIEKIINNHYCLTNYLQFTNDEYKDVVEHDRHARHQKLTVCVSHGGKPKSINCN